VPGVSIYAQKQNKPEHEDEEEDEDEDEEDQENGRACQNSLEMSLD
jgi:hypothetical protein